MTWEAMFRMQLILTFKFVLLFVVQLCVLGNLCPETVEEAIAMVPSIKVCLFKNVIFHLHAIVSGSDDDALSTLLVN